MGYSPRAMTRQLAWLTVLLVGGTALAMLLASLAFVPVDRWEGYVPVAASIGAIGLILAGFVVEAARRPSGPSDAPPGALDRTGRRSASQSLHDLVRQAPAEMAPLLYGLHVTHARLRRTVEELEQDRAEMSAMFEHMADSVLVAGRRRAHRAQQSRPPNGSGAAALVGRRLAEVTRDAELVDLARSVSDSDGPRCG